MQLSDHFLLVARSDETNDHAKVEKKGRFYLQNFYMNSTITAMWSTR